MDAHIICVNDGIRGIVLEDLELAKVKMEDLAKQHYEQRYAKGQEKFVENYSDYRKLLYWHIHTVEVLNPPYADLINGGFKLLTPKEYRKE